MPLTHYLRPLLTPDSIALIGASERPGSLGRVVLENLLDGDFRGVIHAVNPAHRRVLGRRCAPRITAVDKPVDLVLITVPHGAVPRALAEAGTAGARAAVVLSAAPADEGEARRWLREVAAAARKHEVRLLGPHAFGVIRTDIGLNATTGTIVARPGRLALVAQSGAVCTAMLEFASSAGIGFSTVAALGVGIDVGFGELLDALLLDPATDGILLYVESVRDARAFLSALRAAARTKPVIVLKAGRSTETGAPAIDGIAMPMPDAVFDAAMRRAGTVRVRTYTQLFAAARILALGKIAQGERLAIVTNGHGPGTLAADIARDCGVPLARLARQTERRLRVVLPPNVAWRNPVNVRGDADATRMAAAVEAALGDPGVDAVLALHVQRPLTGATDMARAVAAVARRSAKPVLAAWLGAVDRHEIRDALDAGGVPNFFTPENAVEAFSFMAAYRRNQRLLLEVAPPQPEPEPPDLAAAESIRSAAIAGGRTTLLPLEADRLLEAFGLPHPRRERVASVDEAAAAARRMRYPVRLRAVPASESVPDPAGLARCGLRNGRMLARAFADLLAAVPQAERRRARAPTMLVEADPDLPGASEASIGIHTDPVFGPVIAVGNTGGTRLLEEERIVLLPPLNRALIDAALSGSRAAGAGSHGRRALPEALVRVLLRLSTLVCSAPWIRTLLLDPVRVDGDTAIIAGARVVVDPKRRLAPGRYRHMAIHPYPMELVADIRLPDGTALHVRPIRPEDAEQERAFVDGLSEQTRYFRFFYRLHELTPAMLARFTQVDYDRELALVGLADVGGRPAFVGVARYICNPDNESAEFAVVAADAWQGRGVSHALMTRLIASARKRGLGRLEGAVLRDNQRMIRFVESLGFTIHPDPAERDQVVAALPLR